MTSDDGTRARSTKLATAALCILASSSGIANAQPDADASTPLRDGQTIAVSHGATERFVYTVNVPASRTYLLIVEQRGLDLILTIEAPDGTSRALNSPLFRDESELALLGDAGPGPYVVTVRSEEHTGAPGGHAIRLTDLSATAGDEIEAWRSMMRGAAANVEGGEQGWAESVAAYQSAADLWQTLGRAKERAQALFSVATVEYGQLFNWEKAADLAAAAARLYAELNDVALSANAVHLQAAALVEKALESAQSSSSSEVSAEADALFDEALALLGRAKSAHEQLGNVYELGLITNNFGYTHFNRGEFDLARISFQEAAVLMQSIDEWTGELNPLSNIAALDVEAGYGSIDVLERVLEILPPESMLRYRADTLDNLGVTHRLLGDFDAALRVFSSAHEIQRRIEDRQGEGRSLRRIGETYYGLGEAELATQYLEQALPLARETNDARNLEGSLRALGNIAFLDRDYPSALELHRSALASAVSTLDRAHLQLLIVRDLVALGRFDEAEAIAGDVYERAATLGSNFLLAEASLGLGRVQLQKAETQAAIANLQRAAEIHQRLGLVGPQAEALHHLALAAREDGRIEQARVYSAEALDLLESARARVADPELRAFFSASRQDYYEAHIDILMALDASAGDAGGEHLRSAFLTDERRRARLMAELLQEASIDLVRDVDPALEERRAALYERLAQRSSQRDRVLEQDLPAEDVRARLAPLLADLAATENELKLLEIETRGTSPELLGARDAPVPSVVQIQGALDPESILLQYALGDERSYVWAVTNDDLVAVELAGRATIEAAVQRALGELTAVPGASRGTAADESLSALAELVLTPVAAHLRKPRVLLVLDGALQYVPFAVLPVTETDATGALMRTHEVVDLPSMSALIALRARADRAPPGKTLALFADPVLDAADPRFGRVVTAAQAAPSVAAVRSSSGASLERLPSTGWEADAISALVAEEQRFVARSFDARRETLFAADLGQYRLVHFATHGLVDSRYPSLSALALSQFDERGVPQNGFLRLHDIYGLDLNADLVVLSACETALGREIRGEGLMGLTQGFLYAGARGVVASLWQVPDRATAELMARFYGHLLNDGLQPAEALGKAQLSMAAERRWSHPYYWGGFVLVGDWR
jgi:CHAT domain-containing protein